MTQQGNYKLYNEINQNKKKEGIKMNKVEWKKDQFGCYESQHILVTYLGEDVPKYRVLGNPDGEGWVLASYDTFAGEYTTYNEELVFNSPEEAKEYVDTKLNN
ncbi:hypothetical protein B4086_5537 [Bacillus cereus]|nr:hypothetical protein B4086_5537 [Bacillus cereus]